MAVVAFLLGRGAAAAQIPVTAAWDRNIDAHTVGYRVSVGLSPGSSLARLDVGGATSVVLPLAPGQVYYVSVRGYTASGVEGLPSVEAVVDLANAPGAPTAVAANVQSATASLSWAPPASGGVALRYLLSVGTSPGASNLLSDYPVGRVTGVSGALPPGVYYARVQAGNMVGVGPTSAEVVFSVDGVSLPNPPRAVTATTSGSAVTLRWTAPAGGADSYVLEAGTASGAANLGVIGIGTTSFATVAPRGTYFVRVRAVRGSATSAPSNEVVVRIN